MVKSVVSIHGSKYEIIEEVKNFIDEIVTESVVPKDVVVKSVDIFTNISKNYYFSKKYEYISTTSKKEGVYGDMYNKVEDKVNEYSTPREYEENIKNSTKYLNYVIKQYNAMAQNEDTWEKDFQEQNNVSDAVMSAINQVIYDSSIDEYNKPSFSETILDAINVGIKEHNYSKSKSKA